MIRNILCLFFLIFLVSCGAGRNGDRYETIVIVDKFPPTLSGALVLNQMENRYNTDLSENETFAQIGGEEIKIDSIVAQDNDYFREGDWIFFYGKENGQSDSFLFKYNFRTKDYSEYEYHNLDFENGIIFQGGLVVKSDGVLLFIRNTVAREIYTLNNENILRNDKIIGDKIYFWVQENGSDYVDEYSFDGYRTEFIKTMIP